MNQSDTGISDIDQSPLSISCGIKKRGKKENSGCTSSIFNIVRFGADKLNF